MPDVTVIGGGLAGMSAALHLARLGCRVSLYEASGRLGGKAGANRNGADFDDHGFHIFPSWYLNIWQLVEELGIRHRFVDLHDFIQLHRDDFTTLPPDQFKTLHDAAAFRNVLRNLWSSPLPFYQTLLFFYSTIDLATHRLKQKAMLDQISITGFLRSKFYRTEKVAEVYQDLMLKAISVPAYFVSAATTRHVIRYWMKHPLPMHYILRGNLQQFFIEPFEAHLVRHGVQIFKHHKLERLEIDRDRIAAVRMLNAETGEPRRYEIDQLVLAVPPECLAKVCTPPVYEACTTLGNVTNLRSRPMAALNIHLRDRIPDLPPSHVNLIASRYGLTFIDVAQTWQGLPGSVLNVIATDYSELEGVATDTAADRIIAELQRFVPFNGNPIVRRVMQPHLDAPLFMNDVGIWHFRPRAVPLDDRYRVEVQNLFFAGDYCKSHVDLVSMEGAFTTGLLAAEALRARALPGTSELKPLEPDRISYIWWVAWLVGLPFAAVLKLIALASRDVDVKTVS